MVLVRLTVSPSTDVRRITAAWPAYGSYVSGNETRRGPDTTSRTERDGSQKAAKANMQHRPVLQESSEYVGNG